MIGLFTLSKISAFIVVNVNLTMVTHRNALYTLHFTPSLVPSLTTFTEVGFHHPHHLYLSPLSQQVVSFCPVIAKTMQITFFLPSSPSSLITPTLLFPTHHLPWPYATLLCPTLSCPSSNNVSQHMLHLPSCHYSIPNNRNHKMLSCHSPIFLQTTRPVLTTPLNNFLSLPYVIHS
jgi:hypothetical protein